jgi:hypothetical protein
MTDKVVSRPSNWTLFEYNSNLQASQVNSLLRTGNDRSNCVPEGLAQLALGFIDESFSSRER